MYILTGLADVTLTVNISSAPDTAVFEVSCSECSMTLVRWQNSIVV